MRELFRPHRKWDFLVGATVYGVPVYALTNDHSYSVLTNPGLVQKV